jgi:NAD(P)-dependent dehydrogenase (short-subunit alcohol dehydrogenase family)
MSGRTVVVAGAGGGGIGTAISGLLAAAGALVVGVDNQPDALDDFTAATTGVDSRPHPAIVGDMRKPEDVDRAVEAAGDAFHGLVHVAGGMLSTPWDRLVDLKAQDFDDLMELNLRSMFLTSTASARRLMALGRGGSIVAIASIAGISSMPFGAPYSAAKAAVMSMVRTAALEWGEYDIRINAVAPGTVRTPRALKNNPNPPPDTPAEKAAVPLGRRGHADDIAGAVAFLMSDLAGWITGQVLSVDGGATARPPFVGEDNLPVFVHDDELRARLFGSHG